MMNHIAEHPRCAIFAAMGSGKTSATLHALAGIGVMDEGPGIIIAPKRVAKDTWPDEARRWTSLAGTEVVPVIGDASQRKAALRRDTLWHAINYEQIPWLVEYLGKANWRWPTIVCDESTRLRGARAMGQGGQRTNALAKVAHQPQVKRFVELTGTPAPNGLQGLWGQLMYLDQGKRLGRSYTAFMERWFGKSFDGHSVKPFPFAQDQIKERIADLCLTVDPRDYGVNIEEPIESDVVVHLPDKVMDQYREMERKMFLELEHDGLHEIEAVHAAARTNKCLQIAAGFVYNMDREAIPLHEEKLNALDSIREEANGMPILVSYIFQHDLVMLKKKFPQTKSIDEITLDDWNAGKVPILAVHPASAGHGLNLQHGSNILVDYTSGWDLEQDQQVIERIGPMRQYQSGLNRPVYRYRIVADRTVDYLVAARRKSKRTVQEILLEALKERKS